MVFHAWELSLLRISGGDSLSRHQKGGGAPYRIASRNQSSGLMAQGGSMALHPWLQHWEPRKSPTSLDRSMPTFKMTQVRYGPRSWPAPDLWSTQHPRGSLQPVLDKKTVPYFLLFTVVTTCFLPKDGKLQALPWGQGQQCIDWYI